MTFLAQSSNIFPNPSQNITGISLTAMSYSCALDTYFCSSLLLCCRDKIFTKRNLVGKRVYLVLYLIVHHQGKKRQETAGRNWNTANEEMMLIGLLPDPHLVTFYTAQTPVPKSGDVPQWAESFFANWQSRKYPTYMATGQSHGDNSLGEEFPFSRCVKLILQTNKDNMKT